MAKKLLNASQEKWLMENYCTLSNKDLADRLTQMVKSEYQKTIDRLERLLPDISHKPTRCTVERQLLQMKTFAGFTEAYVRHTAKRLGCPKKKNSLISEYCKKKAHDTNIKKWMKKATKVENYAEYLRSMRVREIRICIVENDAKLNTLRNAISRYNANESKKTGIDLYSRYIEDAHLMRIEARLNIKD